MATPTGLGKGLGSLIPLKTKKIPPTLQENNNTNDQSTLKILELNVDSVMPNPMQPRQIFEHKDMEELVDSIKSHGVLQPVVVTKKDDDKYELIAGERRLRATKIAGISTIPAIVRDAGEMEKLELALIENIQRHDLNPIEKAESYYRLADEFGITQEEAAKRLGIGRSNFTNTIRLLSLPSEIQKALAENKLTQGHARALLALESKSEQMKLFRKILMTKMNVRDVESQVKQLSKKNKSHKEIDPNIEDKQNTLQSALGTKVEIKDSEKDGKIIIHYYSKEELQNIINKIASDNK